MPAVLRLAQASPYPDKLLQERGQQSEVQRVRTIRQRLCGILVHFHKQPIHASSDARARKMWNVLRLSTRTLTLTTGKLQAVGHVKNNGNTEALHDRKTAKVHHEVVITKRGAALGEEQTAGAVIAHFVHN